MLNRKGFTLVELMVVIVIIGILAALAIPKFTDASAKAKISEAPTQLAGYESAQLAYVAETGKIGAEADLVFKAEAASKWFGYAITTAATSGACTATPKAKVGDLTATDVLITTVTDASIVTHSTTGTAATVKKYCPNFLP